MSQNLLHAIDVMALAYLFTIFIKFCSTSIPEDQWYCKRSPDILALDIYMMFSIGQGQAFRIPIFSGSGPFYKSSDRFIL